MVDKSVFEPYLLYGENGEILGLRKDAPSNAKFAYRQWEEAEWDKQRLKEFFSQQT